MTVLARPEVVLEGDWEPLRRSIANASRAMENTSRTMSRIGRRMALNVTAPLAAIGVAVVKAAVDMDSLRRGLEVSAGSAQAAAGQLNELRRVAELPGLGFKEAIQGAVQLNVAFEGLSNRIPRVNQTLEQFGNAIALTGGGKAELDRVIVQLAQVASASKVLTQDLRPIIQTAPAVATALKQAFGTINAADIEALGLSSEQFFDQLTAALKNLPRASAGARNSFENLSDSVFRARVAIGELLLPAVTRLVDVTAQLAEGLAEVDRSTIGWGIALAGIVAAIPVVIVSAGALLTSLAAIGKALVFINATLAAGGLAAIATGAGLVLGVAALAGAFAFAYTKIRDVADELDRVNQALPTTALNVSLLRDLAPEQFEKLPESLKQLAEGYERAAPAASALNQSLTALNPQMLNLDGASSALAANIALVAEGGDRAARVFGGINHLAGLTVEVFESAGRSILRFTDEMREALGITLAMRTPTELFDDTLASLQVHLDAGRISWETYTRAVEAATAALDEANDAASGGLGVFARIGSALGRFGSLLGIAGLAVPGIGQVAGFSSLIGSFAGGFAHGGRIPAGQWGIAGEAGPEMVSRPTAVMGPADVTPGGGGALALNVNVAGPRNPLEAARDSEWLRALSESVRELMHNGQRFDD
jgi:tape measure domain-containing protein